MAERRLIKYFDDDENLGVIIDWSEVLKEFKSLKIPVGYYDPTDVPFDKVKIVLEVSERSVGKTTTWLLIGMIVYEMYGLKIFYIRETRDMIKPSVAGELFDTIISYDKGRYIRAITNGKYNSVYYHWKKMYYCRKDIDGEMEEKAEEPFMSYLSIDDNYTYKSGMSVPNPGVIIWDECLSPLYKMETYVQFHDLLKTIIREKISPLVVLLSNGVDRNHTLLKEFEVSKEFKTLKVGEGKLITGENRHDQRPIYIEIIGVQRTKKKNERRLLQNKLYFGLGNPKMAAITGEESTWNYDPMPHRIPTDKDIILNRDLRIDLDTDKVQIELTYTEDLGLIVYAHLCSIDYKDSRFLVLKDVTKKNQMYGFGHGKFCKKIWELYEQNKWYYDTNETGAMVETFVKNCRQMRK